MRGMLMKMIHGWTDIKQKIIRFDGKNGYADLWPWR